MKTLKTTKLNAVLVYMRIKNMPPREFVSIGDMELSREVIGVLEQAAPELSAKIASLQGMSGATPEERQKAGNDYNELEKKIGNDKVAAEFEDAEFAFLFQQFEAKGKEWFNLVDEFLSFRKQMNEANSAPKTK